MTQIWMGVGPYVITTIVCTGVLLQADIVIVAHWTYIYISRELTLFFVPDNMIVLLYTEQSIIIQL